MIRFRFRRVLSGWWNVTAGLTPDEIEYEIIINGEVHNGRYCRVADLIALYECTVRRRPSSEHPSNTTYQLRVRDDTVEIQVDERWVPTEYDSLQRELESFLGELFVALDQNSTNGEWEAAVEYMNGVDTWLDFETVYTEVTT